VLSPGWQERVGRERELRRRTRAREAALAVLYQVDLLGEGVLGKLEEALRHALGRLSNEGPMVAFARHLVLGCWGHRKELDERIAAVAENWEIHRMAVIDRNILRMATYEMLHCPDIPPKVSINEAIELAKRFSTADSGAFVNGILDRIHQSQLAKTENVSGDEG